MPALLAISPHLDDAVFSAGGTVSNLARAGWHVTIATCFTANVARPQGFALACQLDKGLSEDIDYMALRRAEDFTACQILGAAAVHLPLLEAPHRGYSDAAALFGSRFEADDGAVLLPPLLTGLVSDLKPALVLAPAAIGNHVDHWIVREVVAKLVETGALALQSVRLWTDWPYADREATRPTTEPEVRSVPPVDLSAKIEAAGAYSSQIKFQFGSIAAMSQRLSQLGSETFWPL